MTTTRGQLIKMIALVTENWEPPIYPEAVISALAHIGIRVEDLTVLANGGVVVPVDASIPLLSAMASAFQYADPAYHPLVSVYDAMIQAAKDTK